MCLQYHQQISFSILARWGWESLHLIMYGPVQKIGVHKTKSACSMKRRRRKRWVQVLRAIWWVKLKPFPCGWEVASGQQAQVMVLNGELTGNPLKELSFSFIYFFFFFSYVYCTFFLIFTPHRKVRVINLSIYLWYIIKIFNLLPLDIGKKIRELYIGVRIIFRPTVGETYIYSDDTSIVTKDEKRKYILHWKITGVLQ